MPGKEFFYEPADDPRFRGQGPLYWPEDRASPAVSEVSDMLDEEGTPIPIMRGPIRLIHIEEDLEEEPLHD